MDFEPEPEHIVCYNEPMFAYNFKIYSRYKNKTYISHCVKYIMINGSIVIKNALEAENSDCFYVPPDIEIEPNAFKSVLAYLHIKTLSPDYEIEMKDEKNIQNMLLICNWFGFTNLYTYLIKCYISLLKNSKRTLNMFTKIDYIRNFLDLSEHNESHNDDSIISCDVSRDVLRDTSLYRSTRRIYSNKIQRSIIFFDFLYNPICGLITGDKLNDSKLIDASLYYFDFGSHFAGVIEPFEQICALLNDHLMRKTTKEKLYLIIKEKRKDYADYTADYSPREPDDPFSDPYYKQREYEKGPYDTEED